MTETGNRRKNRHKELTSTKKTLDTTTKDLAQTKQTLQATKSERDKAVANEAVAKKRAGELTDQIVALQKNLGDTQAKLTSYEATGFSPEQVLTLNKDYKQARKHSQ